jgi:hypothetical protein
LAGAETQSPGHVKRNVIADYAGPSEASTKTADCAKRYWRKDIEERNGGDEGGPDEHEASPMAALGHDLKSAYKATQALPRDERL